MIDPIIVTGCARSGTSMISGVLSACGAFFGDTYAGTPQNAKGFFENKRVREHVIKPMMLKLDADPLGQHPLPPRDADPEYADLAGDVRRYIVDDGYKSGVWAVKGAKILLQWRAWARAFPQAKWVVVWRSPEAIADSCLRTPFMRRRTSKAEWMQWVAEHMARADDLINHVGPQAFLVKSRDVVDDPDSIRWVVEECGLEWNGAAVCDFVEPELMRA